MKTHRDVALGLAEKRPVVRWRDFAAAGVAPASIARLLESGDLERVGRGLYRRPGFDASQHQSLIEASISAPRGVICLASALRFHELTTQLPREVWILIDQKARAPKSASQRLKIIRAGGRALKAGVERHRLDGVSVPITSPAKTVADCFKYRSRIGVDVAIEALREGLKKRVIKPDDFLAMARIDRVDRVARSYLEALI